MVQCDDPEGVCLLMSVCFKNVFQSALLILRAKVGFGDFCCCCFLLEDFVFESARLRNEIITNQSKAAECKKPDRWKDMEYRHMLSKWRVCATLKSLSCLLFCEGCSDNDQVLATLLLTRLPLHTSVFPSSVLWDVITCSTWMSSHKTSVYVHLKSCQHAKRVSKASVACDGIKRSKE